MHKVTGSRLLWIASAGSLALAAAVGGCSSKSSGNNSTTTNEDGGEEDGGSSSSSGAVSSSSSSGAGSSSGSSGGVAEASTGDGAVEAASSSGGAEAGATEAGASTDGGDAGGTTLTVYNYKSWCTVSVNGSPLSYPAPPTAGVASTSVAPGVEISLVVGAVQDGNFELGSDPWLYISGTGGTTTPISGTITGDGGISSTSTTSVEVAAGTAGCVVVCCPFTSGSGCSAGDLGTYVSTSCP